jgi:hypothetical protein
MTEYDGFLRREMPDRVRYQLELRIEDALNPLEETLRGQIVDIVRDTQLELFKVFMSSLGEASGLGTRSLIDPQVMEQGTGGLQDRGDDDTEVEPRQAHLEQTTHAALPEWSWEEQLHAYRPEPLFEGGLYGFDGQLFDFGSLLNASPQLDSAYGTSSETLVEDEEKYTPG